MFSNDRQPSPPRPTQIMPSLVPPNQTQRVSVVPPNQTQSMSAIPGRPPMPGQTQVMPVVPGRPPMPGQTQVMPVVPGRPPMPGQTMGMPVVPGRPPMPGQTQVMPAIPGRPPMPGQTQVMPAVPGRPPMPGQTMGMPAIPGRPPMPGQTQSMPAVPSQPEHAPAPAADQPIKPVTPGMRLGDVLIASNIITQDDLAQALTYQKKVGTRLGEALIELGLITEDQKLKCLAAQLGTSVAEPHRYATVDINVAALIPEHIARRFTCLAVDKGEENELIVIANDALDLKMLDLLRDTTGLQITAILGKKDDILQTIDRCYRDISTSNDATRIAEEMGDGEVEFVKEEEEEVSESAGNELGIIKLVNMLITNAIRDRASDIHIEPQENSVLVRCRVDGDMRSVMSPPKRSHQAIVARIKILADLNIAERRLPQDGRMVMKIGGKREVDIRVSILPTIFGEKVVMRILDKEAFDKSTSNLGFTQIDEMIFKKQITKPYGIVIVTGPTGSGKSTTLYSALQTVKDVTKNIITVEDPVEFHMEGINQVHVNTKIGLTFGAALRSILRQDPDVILIGEIRDAETADIAIKMALTGHLVFSTLHTNDAASSIARFTDIGIAPLMLGSSLNLIIAQRLVRRICTKCKVAYVPDPELLLGVGLDPARVPQVYKGEGCVACNGTGFSGRIALFEMLQVTRDIRKLILKGAPTMEIHDKAVEEGMRTLRGSGLEHVLNGLTTVEQVIAATMET